ncbi:sulfotransferase family 2 domain-containing protein [Roseovarius salinarum]|uniref:sulfotransferase family 2 domain-containing protein n=1 Tax=Roseovarius salinarum TaxID=1981892 RepID=UPI000C3308A1|nr:sulfotransferase family 2 domain-containing protein [Roseovarius salinarum]
MTAILAKHGLAYISVPKVACTSIKRFFFEIENGRPFQGFRANGKNYNIHKLYPGKSFDALPARQLAPLQRFTVVRDPIARFLSCYGNRVGFHRELNKKWLGEKGRDLGLKPNPDVHTFIERLEDYLSVSRPVWWHCRPMVDILGTDPEYYTKIFDISEIEDFRSTVCSMTGGNAQIGRHQTGGEKIPRDELTGDEISFLTDYYSRDYEVYGQFLGAAKAETA